MGRGGALFSNVYFSMKKGFWRSKISWLAENQKNLVFHCVLGDLKGADWCPPHSSNIRSPALLGLKNTPIYIFFIVEDLSRWCWDFSSWSQRYSYPMKTLDILALYWLYFICFYAWYLEVLTSNYRQSTSSFRAHFFGQ